MMIDKAIGEGMAADRQYGSKMTIEEWSRVAMADTIAPEEVVMLARLKPDYSFLMTKKALKSCFKGRRFKGTKGVALSVGDRAEITPSSSPAISVRLPKKVVGRLGLTQGCRICVVRQRDGSLVIKRLNLQIADSEVPGTVLLDSFSDTTVHRVLYAGDQSIGAISGDTVRDLAARMGRLVHNPLHAIRKMDGRAAVLFAQALGDGTPVSTDYGDTLSAQIIRDQDTGGSWGDDLVQTASNLIRLMEVGKDISDPCIARAADWLLESPELIDAPGLFAATVPLSDDINELKEGMGQASPIWDKLCHYFKPKKGLSRKYQPIRDVFDSNRDIVPGVCELGIASASAIVLQALLRLGLSEHLRVRLAITTLIRGWDGLWCGHAFYRQRFGADLSASDPDLNTNLQVHAERSSGLPPTQMVPPAFRSRQVSKGQSVVEPNNLGGDGGCSLAIFDALSWHPRFPGSRMEETAALHFARRQSGRGRWQVPRATMLHNLARLSHPVAALSVAKTIPQLIRDQQGDGLWPEGELDSLRTVAALKHFGLLDTVLPTL